MPRTKTFGYRSSYLPDYIEEKTLGASPASEVLLIPIEQLRALDYDGIAEKLCSVRGFGKVCVDAVDYCDVKVFSVALYRAGGARAALPLPHGREPREGPGRRERPPLLRRREMVTRRAAG